MGFAGLEPSFYADTYVISSSNRCDNRVMVNEGKERKPMAVGQRLIRLCIAAFSGAIAAVAASSASATTYMFTTINDPLATGAQGTLVTDINNTGALAGNFYDGGGYHGFTETGGVFTTIDDPLAAPGSTWVTGINDAGILTGEYRDAAGYHGFLDSGGVFSTLDDPLATGVTAGMGVSNSGVVVGFYNNAAGIHGFSESNGIYSDIEAPVTFNGGTEATSINEEGVVAGIYYLGSYPLPSGYNGFTDDNGIFTSFSAPNPSYPNQTFPYGINDSGTVVGYFIATAGERGFVFDGSTFTTVADPSATGITRVYGINNDGDIVGYFTDVTGGEHGFVATPAIPEPATWAMMLAGFFSLGAVLRRRREFPA